MTAAVAQTSPGKIVPDQPPAATADAVVAQREAKLLELAQLEAHVGAAAYLAITKGKTGAALLAELREKIEATRFEIQANSAAHAYAIEVDKAALADWWKQIHAMPPEQALAGLTVKDCCRRCSEAHGCLISCGHECLHPTKIGQVLNPRHASNTAIRRLQRAAAQQLGVLR